jgi:hypothetical protein
MQTFWKCRVAYEKTDSVLAKFGLLNIKKNSKVATFMKASEAQ